MKEIQIDAFNQGQRIDKFVLKLLPGMSKSFCFKMFRKKNIKLNGHKIQGNEILKSGDEIKVFFADETYDKFAGNIESTTSGLGDVKMDVPLPKIVFEDQHLIVINKAAGIFSQKDPKGVAVTDQIEAYYKSAHILLSTGVKIGVSNRLDRNTSGIILSGKTLPMTRAMNDAIKSHDVQKLYRTIVAGSIKQKIELKGYLKKDPISNKVSLINRDDYVSDGDDIAFIHTIINPIRTNDAYTELEVEIKTGKPHQIRLHLSSIGHPIIGDTKYGDRNINQVLAKKYGLKHQLLHAYTYRFVVGDGLLEDYTKPFVATLPLIYKSISEDVFG